MYTKSTYVNVGNYSIFPARTLHATRGLFLPFRFVLVIRAPTSALDPQPLLLLLLL